MMGQLQVVNVSDCASHQAACVWTGIVVAWLCVAAEVNDRSEGLGQVQMGSTEYWCCDVHDGTEEGYVWRLFVEYDDCLIL